MKRWVIGLCCSKCGARYFLAALNGGVSPFANEEIAKGIKEGDTPFICENSEDLRLETCTCSRG